MHTFHQVCFSLRLSTLAVDMNMNTAISSVETMKLGRSGTVVCQCFEPMRDERGPELSVLPYWQAVQRVSELGNTCSSRCL
jgi:hypothetical protein